jgi:Xaa-Pro aminopeptidase
MNELKSKIREAVADCGCDAILAVGVDNFNYLTGTVLPFAEEYPDRRAAVLLKKGGEGSVVCPFDWSEAVKDQGWSGDVIAYDENKGIPNGGFIEALKELLARYGLNESKIGLDYSRVSRALMDALEADLENVNWIPVDSLLGGLRIIKTSREIDLIETACKQLDRGIIHGLNHLEGTVTSPGYTVAEYSERVRVHINENGSSGVGHLSTTLDTDMKDYYAPSRGLFWEGIPFRSDVSNHYMGYWANQGRMAFTGKTPSEYSEAYQSNLLLKEEAIGMLRPSVACSDLFDRVKKLAEEKGIPLWSEAGMGHGVGTSHHEPPYLNSSDETVLAEGMVVALDIYTRGPKGGLIHSKDIYAIEETGCRKLSWYRDWTGFYEVTGFRAAH